MINKDVLEQLQELLDDVGGEPPIKHPIKPILQIPKKYKSTKISKPRTTEDPWQWLAWIEHKIEHKKDCEVMNLSAKLWKNVEWPVTQYRHGIWHILNDDIDAYRAATQQDQLMRDLYGYFPAQRAVIEPADTQVAYKETLSRNDRVLDLVLDTIWDSYAWLKHKMREIVRWPVRLFLGKDAFDGAFHVTKEDYLTSYMFLVLTIFLAFLGSFGATSLILESCLSVL